jgi:iron complex outermembrane receptor protein
MSHPIATRAGARPPSPLTAVALAAAAFAAMLAPASVFAQTAAPTPAPVTTPTVVVTGNPLGSDTVATPSTVLTGDQLVLRRGSSLGETLDGLPGVSASYFGPNANRPIVRGQDGDRIRILSNAGASLDASSLSFDHAVPIDPLVVERVEVLRGPASLLYGGSAVGGVVNAIDNRIPRDALQGLSGTGEVRFGGPANERGASALLETGGSGFALHADAFWRKTDDQRVPWFDRPLGDGSTERRNRIADSASDAKGGAFGGSAVWDHGYLGAAVDTYRNDYGAVAEEGVTIRMKRDKLALAGEVRDLGGFVTTLRGQFGYTDYVHREVEDTGEIGTTFRNKGGDFRVEAVHAATALGPGRLEGVFGLQGENATFEALGEEAFVPTTHTRQLAAFLLEQWKLGNGLQLSAGARYQHDRVRSDGDADPADAKFGPSQQRSFAPRSASLGAVFDLDSAWQLSGNASYTERSPVSYELYADGVHAATGTYERGDADQRKERSRNLDLGLQYKHGDSRAKAGVFYSRFANYIALLPTGEPDFVDGGETFPVYAFRGVPARLYGMELEGQTRLWTAAASKTDVDARADWVRADNLATGEPLPRIAPLRLTVGLNWLAGPWTTRVEVQNAQKQDRVPHDDTATPGWTLVNLSATYRVRLGSSDALFFAKVNNLGNRLAYNAATIETVRPLAPLGGRALMVGLRVAM